MSPVLDILRVRYRHVETLEEFADDVKFREGQKAALVQQEDSDRFRNFTRSVYICRDTKLQQVPSCNQICTLPELLAFILNKIKRKKRRNVLAHGYDFMSQPQEERTADWFKFRGSVTQSAAFIHGSDMWRKVTVRLGTDITRYLLESCSVFMSVPPSCAFQLCGVPIYDGISMSRPSFQLQTPSRTNCRKYQGTAKILRRRQEVKSISICKKRCRRDVRVRKGKRKTDEEVMTPTKRRRLGEDEPTQGSLQCCNDIVEDVQPSLVETSASVNPVETHGTVSKQTTTMPSTVHPLGGEPSWRSGIFPPLPPSQCFISTVGFMYGGRGMRGFLLNRKMNTSTDGFRRLQGQDLLRIIFFEGLPYLKGVQRGPKKLPRRFFNMAPLFCKLLRQHRKCPYDRILQRMCPAVEGRGNTQGEYSSLLPQHCAPQRVYLFVRECLSSVVPEELWGSNHNRLQFLVRVRSFLRSGKAERLSLAELMWKMKVNDCDWLKISKKGRLPPSELSYRTQALGQFLAWLLDGYVAGLLKARFYVTEAQKNSLRFYRQEVWVKLQDLAFRGHLSKGQMEELTPDQVASLPKATITSHIRFIPKTDGMRPITRVIVADPKTRFYQRRVRDLLDVLQACVRSDPSLLGSTVMGLTDIHKVLRSLAPAQKEKPQPLYFVKVDVSGAFESLPHDKLREVIVKALTPLQQDACAVRCYAKVWADAHHGLKKAFLRQAGFREDNLGFTNMKGFVTSLQRQGRAHNTILVEQHFCPDLGVTEAMEFFKLMLTGAFVRFGKKTYRQCRGIPQGSVVSTLLCCLCYGHMENVLFRDICKDGGYLMRLVDDFLLITPHPHQAQTFLRVLLDGVPQYGLKVNPRKVLANFEVSAGTCGAASVPSLPPRCLFPWCGLLLDTHTLDVQCDYSSYAGLSLRYSLTLGSFHSAGQQMRRKLMAVLRLKCHSVFVTLKTNSLETVYKNIYKLVLLHACRFHVCAQSLPFGQTVAKNPPYFVQMIWDMAHYTNRLIRLSNKGSTLGSKDLTGVLQSEAVKLLFCLSFLLVLSRHRPIYKTILPHLHKMKRRLEKCLGDLRLARVRQATNPRTPVDFLPILV
ncbi:telomerase reverse transcriptase [Genypterus blacodes]|uniref:telomerase reverse transcriptase n=1 Tax=Genypterus blacodes TaxID=154954 RepID=UPI003F75E27A